MSEAELSRHYVACMVSHLFSQNPQICHSYSSGKIFIRSPKNIIIGSKGAVCRTSCKKIYPIIYLPIYITQRKKGKGKGLGQVQINPTILIPSYPRMFIHQYAQAKSVLQ